MHYVWGRARSVYKITVGIPQTLRDQTVNEKRTLMRILNELGFEKLMGFNWLETCF
jgi:hypothetical protein